MGTINIVLREFKAVPKRIVDMGLCRKVHNRVDAFGDEQVIDEICTGNVTADEFHIGGRFGGVNVLEIGAVIELIKHDDFVVRVVTNKAVSDMGSDEACSTSDEDVFGGISGSHGKEIEAQEASKSGRQTANQKSPRCRKTVQVTK